MISKLFITLCQKSPYLKRMLWKQCYEILSGYYRKGDWTFMNYGYAPLDPRTKKLELDKANEPDRYCVQLYHYVANAISLNGLDVLEVGSGRGGGAYYIKRYLHPKMLVGIDFSRNAIKFCKKNYSVEGLTFKRGNAELLPFDDNSFDAVINIESSHCYCSMDSFLFQVRRVLRPNGYFLYADHRARDEIEMLYEQLHGSGMSIIKETNITRNVRKALMLDTERRILFIKKAAPKILVKSFQDFAGVKGSETYERFQTEWVCYLSFVLQKPEHQPH